AICSCCLASACCKAFSCCSMAAGSPAAKAGDETNAATSAAQDMRKLASVMARSSAFPRFREPVFLERFLRCSALQELDELSGGRARLGCYRDRVDDRRMRIGGEKVDDPHALFHLGVRLVDDT